MGFLTIDDKAAGVEVGFGDPDYGEHAIIGVSRIQHANSASSRNIGAMFTDREFGGGYNRVGALDTRLQLNKNWNISAQVMTSQTKDTAANTSGGDAWNISLNGGSRDYYYNLNYTDRSEATSRRSLVLCREPTFARSISTYSAVASGKPGF